MICCPKVGARMFLHYNRRLVAAGAAPHHGAEVVVVARKTKGKPRNHVVRLATALAFVCRVAIWCQPGGNVASHGAAFSFTVLPTDPANP